MFLVQKFLPNEEDFRSLKNRMKIVVKRIITDNISVFQDIIIPEHVPHKHSKESKLKSTIVSINLLFKCYTNSNNGITQKYIIIPFFIFFVKIVVFAYVNINIWFKIFTYFCIIRKQFNIYAMYLLFCACSYSHQTYILSSMYFFFHTVILYVIACMCTLNF